MNEVATDYNAGLTSALARMYMEFGGTPLANFPPRETPDDDEIYTRPASTLRERTSRKSRSCSSTSRHGRRGWATSSRSATSSPSTRRDAEHDRAHTAFSQCTAPTGPSQFSGSIYYVTINCAAALITRAASSIPQGSPVPDQQRGHLGYLQRLVVRGRRQPPAARQ